MAKYTQKDFLYLERLMHRECFTLAMCKAFGPCPMVTKQALTQRSHCGSREIQSIHTLANISPVWKDERCD